VPSFPSPRSTAVLIGAGALGIAATTALEVVTAPYGEAVSAYPLNGAVHVLKVVAALAFAAGLVAWLRQLRAQGERVAPIAAGVLAAGTLAAVVPYSLVEAFLDPGLEPAAANDRLDAIHADQPWIGGVASAALPLIVLSVLTLAVVALRHRLVPAWAPIASLAAVPVAVLAGVAGEAGWPVPHPPTWLLLGLACYGAALAPRRSPTPERELTHASRRSG
jgi:hypothetical protein